MGIFLPGMGVFMKEDDERYTTLPIVAPVHLAGCGEIATAFRVSKDAVRQWKRQGAPMAVIGGRLTAEYNMLMAWHVERYAKEWRNSREVAVR